MSESKGDFLGFTFIINGTLYKSQDLGITRVSDGDRYNESLVPEIEDKTIEIPGLDGTYFYGSDFKTRNFSIKIAFDSMTEENFRTMRQVFGYKHMGLLIFDEAPYKQYKVKVASPPELEYVCFDERARMPSETSVDGVRIEDREEVAVEDTYEEEITIKPGEIESYSIEGAPESITVTSNGEPVPETLWDYEDGILNVYGVDIEEDITATVTYTLSHMEQQIEREKVYPWEYIRDNQGNDIYERIYKGEGTIEFIAYYPFATQTHKFLDDFDQDNVNEWAAASRLLNKSQAEESNVDKINNNGIIVYNGGDMPTGFMIWVPFKKNENEEQYSTNWDNDLELTYSDYSLIISKDIQPQSLNDIGILINTVNNLVEGIKTIAINSNGNVTYETSGTVYNRYVKGFFFKINSGTGYSVIYIPSMPSTISESYFAIINPTGNPFEQGWYEYDENNQEYTLTNDTEVIVDKTYYQQGEMRIFYNYLYF